MISKNRASYNLSFKVLCCEAIDIFSLMINYLKNGSCIISYIPIVDLIILRASQFRRINVRSISYSFSTNILLSDN
jgi:hypothetical protein